LYLNDVKYKYMFFFLMASSKFFFKKFDVNEINKKKSFKTKKVKFLFVFDFLKLKLRN